jgi:hypothetical protein
MKFPSIRIEGAILEKIEGGEVNDDRLVKMRTNLLKRTTCTVAGLLVSYGIFGQDALRGTLTMGLGDVTQIKQRAEAGDPEAQVALGDSLTSRFHATAALQWYQKAAAQGSVEGKFHVGQMLLFGAAGIPADLAVKPNQTEGIRWTFMAATNFHPYACRNMGKALSQGLGTSTNLVAAYAWLKLFSETSPGLIDGKMQMNEMALKLDTASLQQAQHLAARFKAGQWQAPVTRAIPEGDARLKLNGITLGGKTSLAVINGKTLSEGETAKIAIKPGTLTIRCLNIEKNSVTITIEGEDSPRRLRLR